MHKLSNAHFLSGHLLDQAIIGLISYGLNLVLHKPKGQFVDLEEINMVHCDHFICN